MGDAVVSEPFEDLQAAWTGANLFSTPRRGAGNRARAGLTTRALRRWRETSLRVRAGLDRWRDPREHATGASLAFAAPIDQLMRRNRRNEWACIRARPARRRRACRRRSRPATRPHVAHFDDAEALRRLPALAGRSWPGLVALPKRRARAWRARRMPTTMDCPIGEGDAQSWPLDAVGADVPWPELHGIPKTVVTGSNGKTTVRLLAAMLKSRACASDSSTDGVVHRRGTRRCRRLFRAGRRAHRAARSAGAAAVLETARGASLRRRAGRRRRASRW